MKSPDWVIHHVSGGPCEICGSEHQDTFYPGMCDAHTHGLDKYGSAEIQMVLDFQPNMIGYILNSVGDMIRDGLRLKDGDFIEGLFQDGAKLRVFETKDVFGDKVFRLIIPDGEFKYPEDSDEYPYNMQLASPYKDNRPCS